MSEDVHARIRDLQAQLDRNKLQGETVSLKTSHDNLNALLVARNDEIAQLQARVAELEAAVKAWADAKAATDASMKDWNPGKLLNSNLHAAQFDAENALLALRAGMK